MREMARGGEWGHQGRSKWNFSYKKTTLTICFLNIVIALYVLRSIYASIYVYSSNNLNNVVKYTPDQIRNLQESIRIRRANEPIELVKLVKKYKKQFSGGKSMIELPRAVKQRMMDEILQRLQSLNSNNASTKREAVESWRKEKLEEAKQLSIGKGLNSTILQEEAKMLVRALESDWAAVSEELGFWIPSDIIHQEHDDKPEGLKEEELEDDVLPGRPLPPECNVELHTDYGGDAVRWGLTHHKDSAADCCQACLDQAKNAKPGAKKCNIWVYCPTETGCWSPDIYEHTNGECWLKYAEKPKRNFKDKYVESYRNSHPTAPLIVPWVSGVVSV